MSKRESETGIDPFGSRFGGQSIVLSDQEERRLIADCGQELLRVPGVVAPLDTMLRAILRRACVAALRDEIAELYELAMGLEATYGKH